MFVSLYAKLAQLKERYKSPSLCTMEGLNILGYVVAKIATAVTHLSFEIYFQISLCCVG